MRLAEDVDLLRLAHLTPGYVGADLFALIREASTRAVSCAFTTAITADAGTPSANGISNGFHFLHN
jgi:ribosome biogenesis ATPase